MLFLFDDISIMGLLVSELLSLIEVYSKRMFLIGLNQRKANSLVKECENCFTTIVKVQLKKLNNRNETKKPNHRFPTRICIKSGALSKVVRLVPLSDCLWLVCSQNYRRGLFTLYRHRTLCQNHLELTQHCTAIHL